MSKPLQLASTSQEAEPLRTNADLRPQINVSQLHQSRIGELLVGFHQ